MKNGSVESLKVCERCGARANARQILETVDCDMPVAAAMERVDQCVAFFGVSSSVLTITRSTSASVIFRGTPGLGSSHRPSKPFSRKAPPPGADRVRSDPQTTGHLHDRVTVRALQHDPRPLSQRLRGCAPTHPALQHGPLGLSQ